MPWSPIDNGIPRDEIFDVLFVPFISIKVFLYQLRFSSPEFSYTFVTTIL